MPYICAFFVVLEAAEHGRLEILKLLKKLKIPFDKVATIQGTSCLSLATRLNNESALQLLLAQPSLDRDVHFGDAIIGQNALARACRNGNLRVRTCCVTHTLSTNSHIFNIGGAMAGGTRAGFGGPQDKSVLSRLGAI